MGILRKGVHFVRFASVLARMAVNGWGRDWRSLDLRWGSAFRRGGRANGSVGAARVANYLSVHYMTSWPNFNNFFARRRRDPSRRWALPPPSDDEY
jgi:hypothetical protein